MVQKLQPTESLFCKITPKNPLWFWFLFGIVSLALGLGGYSSFLYRESCSQDLQRKIKELELSKNEVLMLRQQLTQKDSAAQLVQIKLANQEILDKISSNFQKIFIFSKLERRVLTGKNFSSSFEKLDHLMGISLKNSKFNILRDNTQGITPPTGIENSFRAYTPSKKPHTGTLGEKIFYLFNGFLKIRSFQEKEKIDSLCGLIRNDHTQQALVFIEKNLPEYKEWSQALKRRVEAKQALRDLEQLVFDSLRI